MSLLWDRLALRLGGEYCAVIPISAGKDSDYLHPGHSWQKGQ
jgi:hypothetical protein